MRMRFCVDWCNDLSPVEFQRSSGWNVPHMHDCSRYYFVISERVPLRHLNVLFEINYQPFASLLCFILWEKYRQRAHRQSFAFMWLAKNKMKFKKILDDLQPAAQLALYMRIDLENACMLQDRLSDILLTFPPRVHNTTCLLVLSCLNRTCMYILRQIECSSVRSCLREQKSASWLESGRWRELGLRDSHSSGPVRKLRLSRAWGRFRSAQGGIQTLKKVHMRSTPCLSEVSPLMVAFESVPVLVWLTMARSCPFQGIYGVILLAFCTRVVSRAPQRLRLSQTQASCGSCFACLTICFPFTAWVNLWLEAGPAVGIPNLQNRRKKKEKNSR